MSDEIQLSNGGEQRSKQDKHSKAKLAKILVESMKEGTGKNRDFTTHFIKMESEVGY